MTTLVWLLILAAILIAITRLGLAIRHPWPLPPTDQAAPRDERHPIDLMS